MLMQQHKLQDKVGRQLDAKYNTLKGRAGNIKEDYIQCVQELNEMLYEVPYFKAWKDYSQMTEKEIDQAWEKVKVEFIDAWHFFMNIALTIGLTADEWFKLYLKKNEANFKRQDIGYDHTMRHLDDVLPGYVVTCENDKRVGGPVIVEPSTVVGNPADVPALFYPTKVPNATVSAEVQEDD